MTPHTWKTEYVDGGHVGGGDFWRCEVCGCAGGPAHFWGKDEKGPTWKPFIPGPALKLPDDCEAAQLLISEYLEGHLNTLENMGSKGLSPKYARRVRRAIEETRAAATTKNFIPLVRLLYDIEAFYRRPTLEQVEEQLREMGYAP